jgi:hypothetical protein
MFMIDRDFSGDGQIHKNRRYQFTIYKEAVH